MATSYEETIAKISIIKWERQRNFSTGLFLPNDTGRLIIFARDAIMDMEGLIRVGYLSFLRPTKENKNDVWCISIQELLRMKFAPKKEVEFLSEVIREKSSLIVPLPIMLNEEYQLHIYLFEKGKKHGRLFRVNKKN